MNSTMKLFALVIALSFFFTRCTKEEAEKQVSFQITDAPIDDADVKAVFITVTQVKVDGAVFSGFSGKQTFDVKALQNGAVKVLGNGSLDARAYSNISLVLDLDTDAAGNAMGCYIERLNGTKESLAAGATGTVEITCQNAINLLTETRSAIDIVLDFDLRKAIQHNSSNNSYQFVSTTELSASVRTMLKHKTGSIAGNCTDNTGSNNDKVIAYVYPRGAYSSSEQNAQGSGNIQFKNAISSCQVDNSGNFKLSYLNSGEYEVVFAAYDYDAQNQATFKGMLEVGGVLSGNVLGIVTVEASVEASLNFSFSGFL